MSNHHEEDLRPDLLETGASMAIIKARIVKS
ncbi:hypothetical protein N752_04855 [Desulforamulus aquiferis]|nr:hypothetical protein N752_04855 [Desulforamulus aquiferis]